MKKKTKKFKRTSDGLRVGSILHLTRMSGDEPVPVLPIEMEWAKKWAIIKILTNDHLIIRNKEMGRDIAVIRKSVLPPTAKSASWFTPVIGEVQMLRFIPAKDFAFLLPGSRTYKPRTTSVSIGIGTALDFVKEKTGMSLTQMINDAINTTASKIVNDMARSEVLNYFGMTTRLPDYLPVFNCIVSTDIAFLQHLKMVYGGKVNAEQMRWIAFDGDDLSYRPDYATN